MKHLIIFALFVYLPWSAMAIGIKQTRIWPDLPLLNIVTQDCVPIQNNIITAPEGCIGQTTNNEYIGASMIMTLKGDTLLNTGNYVPDEAGIRIRIRIRGNSTGVNSRQHPYKLKLTKKADLITPQHPVAPDKDWVLINGKTWNPSFTNEKSGILNWVGNALSRAIGMEWTPRTAFVNVMVNGNYEGVYTLTESVERDAQRINIHKSGFILENDIYFWKDEKSFKTDHQLPFMGYTFKYPDTDKIDDERIEDIAEFMNEFEDRLYKKQDISKYIDYSSFARWILAHDILGSIDGGGTNMFVAKDRFDSDNPLKGGPMKMCVLWDFESIFRCEPNAFASCHLYDYFYYHKLFERTDFCTTYQNIYNEVRPKLMKKFVSKLHKMVDTYSGAYEESMAMHNQIFPNSELPPLSQQVDEAIALLEIRLTNLDNMIPRMVQDVIKSNTIVAVYDLHGRRYRPEVLPKLPRGVYLFRYDNGKVIRKFAGK